MMRTFGEALDSALGDRRGLTRYGESRVPMDEALAYAVVDLSGRATANISITPDPGMAAHAFQSLAQTARITLHVTASGENDHHVAEACFKAVGRALAQALTRDGTHSCAQRRARYERRRGRGLRGGQHPLGAGGALARGPHQRCLERRRQ
jgi:imidazoleglycerol phosphate dehydratase HisB